jgi:hypothetical protein
MALEALISEIEAAQAATGYPGYTTIETRVTSADRAIPDGYMGYAGYTSIGISGNAVKRSGELEPSKKEVAGRMWPVKAKIGPRWASSKGRREPGNRG